MLPGAGVAMDGVVDGIAEAVKARVMDGRVTAVRVAGRETAAVWLGRGLADGRDGIRCRLPICRRSAIC